MAALLYPFAGGGVLLYPFERGARGRRDRTVCVAVSVLRPPCSPALLPLPRPPSPAPDPTTNRTHPAISTPCTTVNPRSVHRATPSTHAQYTVYRYNGLNLSLKPRDPTLALPPSLPAFLPLSLPPFLR
eukprot:3935312-Rhodomonas_salina.1